MSLWSVTWTVLPNGFAPPDAVAPSRPGRGRLSLVPRLRVVTDDGVLRQSPVMAWPALVAGVRTVELEVAGEPQRLRATVTSPVPDPVFWTALFAPTTPVEKDEDEGPIFVPVVTSVHYGPVLAALDRVYAAALADAPTARLPAAHPALRTVTGLTEWSADARADGLRAAVPAPVRQQVDALLEPTALTAARIDAAAGLLRGAGAHAAADSLPLALVAGRLRAAGAGPMVEGTAAPAKQPSHVGGIRPVERADFHQVAGLVSDHPALALALGLRVDVEVEPFEGTRTVRVVQPLAGGAPALQPWSTVTSAPRTGRFVMAAAPGGEVAGGMLDLSPPGKYVTTTSDVVGQAARLRALAGTLASATAPAEVGLPARRNAGITVAQVDRRTAVVGPALARGSELAARTAGGPGAGDVVLTADDVTAGYRVDVSVDGGEFRSLMRRRITYSLNPDATKDPLLLTARDEGFVEAATATEQYDPEGVPQLSVGENLWAFDGWSMVVPRPGRRVTGEAAGGGGVADVDPGVAPGYPLAMRSEPEPGTLTPLRFGRSYRFRARAVDLAGNSVDPAAADPAAVSAPVPYRRLDPVLPPVRVPRRPFSFGESLDRIVVRTDDGVPVDAQGAPLAVPAERHLAAPKTTQQLAETHGAFDAALGPRRTQADRDRQYAVARNEEGVFTDVTVPDPADPARRVPAAGIRVVTNDGAVPPPKGVLPVRRGTALAAGQYVVHDTDTLNLPYLPDVAAAGAALTGLPGTTGPVTLRYAGGGWPDARPARLLVRPGPQARTDLTQLAGRSAAEVVLAPATEVTVEVSSAIRAETVTAFDLPDSAALRKAAVAGQVPLVSPRDTVTLVHAVRKPLLPLEVTAVAAAARAGGSTVATIAGAVTVHPGSTARVDLEVLWDEPVDDGTSEVRTEHRSSTAEPLTVPVGTSALDFSVTQHFGDTRRRDVTVRPIGTTRHREYFATGTGLTRTGAGRVAVVPNAARPEPPDVHSVLPLFRWSRTLTAGGWDSRRIAAGFRVRLRRPWMMTGTGERLGVVVLRDGSLGPAVMAAGHKLGTLVTRWAADPLEGGTDSPVLIDTALGAGVPADGLARTIHPGLPLLEPGADSGIGAGAATVVGHEVTYDPDRDHWFADVEMHLPAQTAFPFVRLALVRLQPESVPGCHLSRVVLTDLLPLPPTKFLAVSRSGPGQLTVRLIGRNLAAGTVTASLVRTGAGSAGPAVVQDLPGGTLAKTTLALAQLPNPEYVGTLDVSAALAAPRDFHVVVTETQQGDYLHRPSTTGRATYFDVVEGDRLAELLG